MKNEFDSRRLDVKAFAAAQAVLDGDEASGPWERIRGQSHSEQSLLEINWSVSGELKRPVGRPEQVWAHLGVTARLPLTCQRCLGEVESALQFERSFRFVADEETAAALDADSEEDVLALSRTFDLLDLVEDEILMEMPLVPRHEQCPVPVKLSVVDEGFEEAMEAASRPFDALAALRKGGAG